MTARMMITAGMLAVGVAVTTLPAVAAPVPARLRNQDQRINQGVRSGQLTRREARNLRTGERRIARHSMRAHRHGMTRMSHRRLEHQLNRQSRRIYVHKHNGSHR